MVRLRPQRLGLPLYRSAEKLEIEAAREGQHLPYMCGAADALQMAAPATTVLRIGVLGGASRLYLAASHILPRALHDS